MNHHDFGPSSLEQYRICPGAYVMQQGIPETTSAAAEEGTILHNAVATGNLDGLDSAQEFAVTKCIDFYKSLIEPGDIVLFEKKLELIDPETNDILTFGTADLIIVNSDTGKLIVIDWKFGYTPVKDVAQNIQLATYCTAAMKLFGISNCTGYVFQPRIAKKSSHTFSNPDAVIENVRRIIKRAKSYTLVLNAAESSCRYCRARLNCPAFRVHFQKLAASRGTYDLTELDTLIELYDIAQEVKSFIKEIEGEVKHCIEENGSCGKYIFQYKDGNREISDIPELYAAVKDMLTQNEFHSACKVSVTKIENMLCEKIVTHAAVAGEKITKAEGKKRAGAMIQPMVSRGNPTKSIVLQQ